MPGSPTPITYLPGTPHCTSTCSPLLLHSDLLPCRTPATVQGATHRPLHQLAFLISLTLHPCNWNWYPILHFTFFSLLWTRQHFYPLGPLVRGQPLVLSGISWCPSSSLHVTGRYSAESGLNPLTALPFSSCIATYTGMAMNINSQLWKASWYLVGETSVPIMDCSLLTMLNKYQWGYRHVLYSE